MAIAPYLVHRAKDRWVFVPSPVFAAGLTGAFAGGTAFVLYLSTVFFRRAGVASANLWSGTFLLLVAGVIAGFGFRAWRTRRTPLDVECSGRVRYGETELCAAGTVASVRIGPSRGGEAGDCEVFLQTAGGKLVSIPSQYFGGFRSRDHARPFAAEIAEALGVLVTESR